MEKWILLLTTPLGRNWVLGKKEEKLSLTPILPDVETKLKDVFTFESEEKAAEYLTFIEGNDERGAEIVKYTKPKLAKDVV